MQTRVQNIVVIMTKAQRREMLRDIIDNMVGRGDAEEITRFVIKQLDGDAVEVAFAYSLR